MLRAVSHLVIATADVSRMTRCFSELFSVTPHFENDQFAEFVLPSRFRVAFFQPVGAAKRFFGAPSTRDGCAFGLTVENVDAVFSRVQQNRERWGLEVSGPPKEHPWGEKSFLLVDSDGNRWEIAQSPSEDGMLVPR